MKLNVAILYDELDGECGATFSLSKEFTLDLLNRVEEYSSNILLLSADNTDKNTISTKLANINNVPFVCFAFCHGTSDALKFAGQELISIVDNHYLFSGALMCAFSCYSAGVLADVLLRNGLRCYVGYVSEAKFPISSLDTITVEMDGVTCFLHGGTVREMCEKIRTGYKQKMQMLLDIGDSLQASFVNTNLTGLIIKGDTNLTINDFLYI